MPISVRCQCGHALQVPDSAGGKSGKCPKCGESIRIPAGSKAGPEATTPAASTKASQGKAATTRSKKPSGKAASTAGGRGAPVSAIDSLLDTAGIGKQQGPVCPSCQTPIKPGATICIECGFHLERGEKLAGYQTTNQLSEFKNRKLQLAAEDLSREEETDKRIKRVGMPWWVMLSNVAGLIFITLAGVMKVEASQSEVKAAKGTLVYAMQKMPFVTLAPFVITCIAALVVVFSFCAILVSAYRRSMGQGLAATFVPGYSLVYAIMHRRELHTTANVHLFWVPVLIGSSIWFYANKGLTYFR